MVAGRKIPFEISEKDIFELEFYPENPRISHILSQYAPPVTQETIEEKLWEQDHVKDLFQNIKRHGGLIEEIIVKGNQVIEGNSRLCAYRHLFKNATTDEEKENWRHIRVKILPSDISEEEIFVLLGNFHIKLKTQWKPYEKAGYVYKMIKKLNKTPEELAEMLSTSVSDIRSDIASYEIMMNNKVESLDKFSYFKEFYKDPNLQKRVTKDAGFSKVFVNMVVNDKIPEARDVRKLDSILVDKKVGPKLLGGILTFEEAHDWAKDRHPELESKRGPKGNIYKFMREAEQRLRKAPIQQIKQEIEKNAQKKATVKYFVREVYEFADNVGLGKIKKRD